MKQKATNEQAKQKTPQFVHIDARLVVNREERELEGKIKRVSGANTMWQKDYTSGGEHIIAYTDVL